MMCWGMEFTSSEYVAKHLYDWAKARWPEVSAIRIYETPQNNGGVSGGMNKADTSLPGLSGQPIANGKMDH